MGTDGLGSSLNLRGMPIQNDGQILPRLKKVLPFLFFFQSSTTTSLWVQTREPVDDRRGKAESSMAIASEESSSVEKDSVSPAEAGSSVGVSISPPLSQADSRTSIKTSARAEMIFPPAFRRSRWHTPACVLEFSAVSVLFYHFKYPLKESGKTVNLITCHRPTSISGVKVPVASGARSDIIPGSRLPR